MSIFKTNDIRGIYGSELTNEVAFKIGKALTKFLKSKNNSKNVIVGYDSRLSSNELLKFLRLGINSEGFDVESIGLCSTPKLFFATINSKCSAGIMITASHNPKEYNGFKLYLNNGEIISYETGLRDIQNLVDGETLGVIHDKNIDESYKGFIKKFYLNTKYFKIVIDAGNGTIGKEISSIFRDFNCEIIPLYFEPNGSFPNHEANPLIPDNLKAIKEAVISENADFGAAFDTDGDRVIFIDEEGNEIRGEFILALIARHLLEKSPNQKILYNLISSKIVKEYIKAYNGIPIQSKVGSSMIKKQMISSGAILAGEVSGHYYYKENNYGDSALITLIMLMQILSKKKERLSRLILPLKKYFHSGEINIKLKEADKKIDSLKALYEDAELSYLDGLTAEYSDWWFNVRKSNTEPLVRMAVEANTEELMKEKVKELYNLLIK